MAFYNGRYNTLLTLLSIFRMFRFTTLIYYNIIIGYHRYYYDQYYIGAIGFTLLLVRRYRERLSDHHRRNRSKLSPNKYYFILKLYTTCNNNNIMVSLL